MHHNNLGFIDCALNPTSSLSHPASTHYSCQLPRVSVPISVLFPLSRVARDGRSQSYAYVERISLIQGVREQTLV